MTNLLFPYPTLVGDVVMSVDSVELDGRAIPVADITPTDRRIAVYAVEKARWDELIVSVSISLPVREIEEIDRLSRHVVVVIRARCKLTSMRQSVVLTRVHPAVWQGAITLSFDAYDKQVILDAVATVDAPERHIVGTAESWTIDLIPRPKARNIAGTLIDCHYIDFSAANEVYLQRASREIAYVDLHRDRPSLWLNDGVRGLRSLLGEQGERRGHESPFRDLTANELAAKTWHSMFDAAAAGLEDGNGDEYPPMPGGWEGYVLQRILPELYPGSSRDQALLELRAAFIDEDPAGMRNIQSEIGAIIDRIVGASRTIRNFIARQEAEEDDNAVG